MTPPIDRMWIAWVTFETLLNVWELLRCPTLLLPRHRCNILTSIPRVSIGTTREHASAQWEGRWHMRYNLCGRYGKITLARRHCCLVEIRCLFCQSASPVVPRRRSMVIPRPGRSSATAHMCEKLIQGVDLGPTLPIRSSRG